MAALLVDALPTGDEWPYEAKFDGYRALALKDGAGVKIRSRKGNDLTADYPAIRQALGALKATSAVIDGEIVAFDESGRPSFQLNIFSIVQPIQRRRSTSRSTCCTLTKRRRCGVRHVCARALAPPSVRRCSSRCIR